MAAIGDESGLSIRDLDTLDEIFAAHDVIVEIWGGRDPMPAPLMRALQYSGNYVVGLYDGDRVVGASVAFFAFSKGELPRNQALIFSVAGSEVRSSA